LRRPPIGCRARCDAETRAQGEQGGESCGGRAGWEWREEEVECYEVVEAEGEGVCSLMFVMQVDRSEVEGDWLSGTMGTGDCSEH
jgi:hypothetical protein